MPVRDLTRDPISLALDVLRSRSGFLVMREVFYGTHRFDELQRRLGVAPASLSARLRTLVDDGLLDKVPYQEEGKRSRHEYQVSRKGAALLPVLVALAQWGNEHLVTDGEALTFAHLGCGASVGTEVRCDAGHDVPLHEVQAER